MEDAEVLATLALSLVPGIGSQRLRALIAAFGSAQAALDAPQSKLAAIVGIGRTAATAIKEARPEDGSRVLERLRELGARVLLAGEPDFPPQLEEIPDPPTVLYGPAWRWSAVAITRRTVPKLHTSLRLRSRSGPSW